MKKYLMNTATGSVDTEENWVSDWEGMGGECQEFDPFGILVEVQMEDCDENN